METVEEPWRPVRLKGGTWCGGAAREPWRRGVAERRTKRGGVVEGTEGVADGVREADEAGRRGGSWGRRRAVAPWGRWGRRERETAPARRSSVGKMGAAAWGRVSRNGRRGEAAPGAVEKKLLRRLGEVGVPCGVVWGDRVCLFPFFSFFHLLRRAATFF